MVFKIAAFLFAIKVYAVLGDFQIGPYKLVIFNVTACPGPLGMQEVQIYLDKNPSGVQYLKIDGYIKNTVGPLGAEMTWSVFRKTNYVAIFTLQTKRVCDILKTKQAASMFPKVDNRCFLMKGPYRQDIEDVNAANHVFLGNMMPYGKSHWRCLTHRGARAAATSELCFWRARMTLVKFQLVWAWRHMHSLVSTDADRINVSDASSRWLTARSDGVASGRRQVARWRVRAGGDCVLTRLSGSVRLSCYCQLAQRFDRTGF
ncbi:hypothetical protein EVAR_24926_1 [Eumeta japonica]|uniref:Uncharacterized protein n=1 Tax=Eumeta variegata TaxID=151549 RepID=A0A4C1V6T9_EUMVA|nr:hypothetical protein EVAR_24926_1 [Eumeta japonica]